MVEGLSTGKPVDPVLQVNPVSLPYEHKGGQPFSLDRDSVPLQEPLQSRLSPTGRRPEPSHGRRHHAMLLQSSHRSIGGETTPPVVDGDPVSIEHNPFTLVQWHCLRRRHSAGQHRGPHRVVELEPSLGMWERLDRPVPAQPVLQHLGVGSALRRVVVIDEDPPGEGHGARRPSDHRPISPQLCHVEEPQAVEDHDHVATGDAKEGHPGQKLGHLDPVPGDRRTGGEANLVVPCLVKGLQPLGVLGVELARAGGGLPPVPPAGHRPSRIAP